jgi:hypothetical protein
MICEPVVITHRALAEASGKLNVCTDPVEETVKFVPLVPVVNV